VSTPIDRSRRRARPLLSGAAAALALGALLLAAGPAVAATPLELELRGGGSSCTTDAVTRMESCVRVNGNSAPYPDGTLLALEADLTAPDPLGFVPIRFLDFWIPDVEIVFDQLFFVDAPAKITGLWHPDTGEIELDPFDVAISGGMTGTASDFPLTTEHLASQTCSSGSSTAEMTGAQLTTDPTQGTPGTLSLTGSDCIEDPGETMLLVLTGDVVSLPEPAEVALGAAALATLALLRGARRGRTRPS